MTNELIKIKQKEDGTQAVSARELHSVLDISSNFSTWMERMLDYGFEEGKDFIPFLEESTGGRPKTDIALTVETAKHIAMIQRSEKGKQVRDYFIECEKQLKETKALTSSEMFLMQAQINVEQDKKLSLLDERLSAMEHNTTEARKMLTSLPDGGAVPDKSFRSLCNEKVRSYSVQSGLPYSEILAIAYKELYYLYGVNLNTSSKNKGMSKLDAAEEMGVMKDLYAVVSKICG